MLCSRHWSGSYFITYDVWLDADRVEHSARRIREVQKRRRKHLALLRTRKEEAAIEAVGGVSYGPGLVEEDKIENRLGD